MKSQKAKLRKEIRSKLASLSAEEKDRRSEQIIAQLQKIEVYQSAQVVLLYLSTENEVHTHREIKRLLEAQEKTIVIPFCEGNELSLFRLESFEDLTPGAYGILEPLQKLRNNEVRHIDPETIDVALIPGIAFDENGSRLGQGKGYYDRFLSQVGVQYTIRIGLCFDEQLIPQVPREAHDQVLHMVVSEKGLLTTNN